ncbi:MAG: hypothetical protein R3C56_36440 [Pirellulaceae bacterium]
MTAPQLFPEKTLAYVRIDDMRQLKADLGRSSIGKLGNDEQLKPILSGVLWFAGPQHGSIAGSDRAQFGRTTVDPQR